jgi:hypothetical protein
MNAALAIAVCTLVGAVTAPNASVAETKKVDGYEGYKFGMTLEQALKVRPYARQIQCDYDDATTCIEYESTISGFPATVTVQFRPTNQLLLSKILIAFSSMDEPIDHTCPEVGKALLKLLLPKYGEDPLIKDHQVTWSSPEGGSVSLSVLCIGPEKGLNVISYQPSSAL